MVFNNGFKIQKGKTPTIVAKSEKTGTVTVSLNISFTQTLYAVYFTQYAETSRNIICTFTRNYGSFDAVMYNQATSASHTLTCFYLAIGY